MFPNIEGQDRLETVSDRVIGIGILSDGQFASSISLQPNPAGAEKADAFGFEFGFEGDETPPLFLNLCFQPPGRAGRDARRELREVQVVVQDLTCIVEDGSFRLADDFFEGHILERGAGNQFVEVVDVGLEVFAVVEGKGLGTDDGFEGVGCVREVDEFMHCFLFFLWFFRVLCRVPGSGSSG